MAAPTLDLIALRKRIGLTQAEMAERMGLGSRAYFTLEQDPASINARHIMLAQMVSLREAVERHDRSLADAAVAALADEFARLARVDENNRPIEERSPAGEEFQGQVYPAARPPISKP